MPEILPDRHSGLLFERLEHPPSPARPVPGSAKKIRAPPFVQQPCSEPAESPEHLRKTTTQKYSHFQLFCKLQKRPAIHRAAFTRQRSLVRNQHRPL